VTAAPRRFRQRPFLILLLAQVLAACGPGHQSARIDAVQVVPSLPQTTPFGVRAMPLASAETPGPAAPAGSNGSPQPSPSGHPASSIYLPGAHGYDASYPQCSGGRVPGGAGFAIVGVNRGKAFTTNPCLGREWRSAAAPPRAVYLNSGFKPDNYSKATSGCRKLSKLLGAPDERRKAYAIGCSEAVYSLAAMRTSRISKLVMSWIDVELANSWDEGDVNLNRFALQGEIDQLGAVGPLPGLYSSSRSWGAITGNWSPPGVAGNWTAGIPPATACGSAGFSGAPVWLVQEAATWPQPSGYDSDWAC
jgi:hypothetical protein